MRVDYSTDSVRPVEFKSLNKGTAFQTKGSRKLLVKINDTEVFDLGNGQVCSFGEPYITVCVIPRYDAVIVFERAV
jgi:hypothetical protein